MKIEIKNPQNSGGLFCGRKSILKQQPICLVGFPTFIVPILFYTVGLPSFVVPIYFIR